MAGEWPALGASGRLHRSTEWLLARPLWLRALMLFALIAATHPWLYAHSSFYWYLPGGLRFIFLLLLPWRYWPAIIGGEYLGRVSVDGVAYPVDYVGMWWGIFFNPLSSLPVLWWLKRRWKPEDIEHPRGMWLLLAGMVLNGIANTAVNFGYVLATPDRFLERNALNWVVTSLVGTTDVALVFAPLAVALMRWREMPYLNTTIWRDISLAIGFVLLVLLVTGLGLDRGGLRHDYLPLLLPLPMVYFAYRHGWRGATIALLVLALAEAINIRGGVFPGANSRNLLLLDLSGFMALMLGSAMDTQRRSRRELAGRNRELRALGTQLQKAARRNLMLEERQLKRVVGTLHDELGQSLTALRTQLKLAEADLAQAGLAHFGVSLARQIDSMRASVRGLMNGLRPAALDELGLLPVLRAGPIREFVNRAGLEYQFTHVGDHDLLADLRPDVGTAIYRIAQECATNCVRHARASRFSLRLLVERKHGQTMVVLEAVDDGCGIAVDQAIAGSGRGLQGMRDRVLAFQGVMHLKALEPVGTRIRVLLVP